MVRTTTAASEMTFEAVRPLHIADTVRTAAPVDGPLLRLEPETGIDAGLRIPVRDGFALAATLYEPAGGWRGGESLVLMSSATAAPRAYYEPFARFLAGRGLAVLTYDYRGIGGSRPASLRGFRARLLDWGTRDFPGMVDWGLRHVQPRRLLAVGHSVGGQILGLADNNRRIAAAMIVAAQDAWYGHWPARQRLRMALRWHLEVPLVSRIFGYVPGWAGIKEDLPGGVAREWASWCRHPGFLLHGHEERRAGFERFDRDLLAFSFADDPYAPRRAVESLLRLYSGATIEHRHVTPGTGETIGHFGFFRERFRSTLWEEAAVWLESRA